ncbi:hypothetical protein DFH07DRAFT_728803 [Mycena maculata]|uniref:Reverse transcriptase zinc-binding domain-containing protein n=1 Tax=Mycena maculata TaxID=230809 RepID=A0AAD7KCS4_9AGAR|nr:hypothetical protein DFH07DRAFT_728803 [Mycena maculata]
MRDTMNKKLHAWEHEGWAEVQHCDILRCLAAELKARKAQTFLTIATPGSQERETCRQASMRAKRAARTPSEEQWVFTIPLGTALPALSLQGNCQRVFYRSIREVKTMAHAMTPRPSTSKMLETVKKEARNAFGRYVTDTDIWKALRTKDFLPRTAQFLWKGVHNMLRIGKYWTYIPECGEHTVCSECDDATEDLEHILLKCTCPGWEIVWKAAETLWREKKEEWPTASLGTILGCGLAEFQDEKGKIKQGTQRLYRILMSESAYLIWKLRNEWRITQNGTPASEQEILNRWKSTINQRPQVDLVLANRPRKGKHPALTPQLVINTWSGTLDNELNLPADWTWEHRVLVGNHALTQAHPRQRNSRGIG